MPHKRNKSMNSEEVSKFLLGNSIRSSPDSNPEMRREGQSPADAPSPSAIHAIHNSGGTTFWGVKKGEKVQLNRQTRPLSPLKPPS